MDRSCVDQVYHTQICKHVERFYSKIAGDPIVIWYLHEAIFDVNIVVECKESDTGDTCHRNLTMLTSGQARKFAKAYCKPESLNICLDDNEVAFDHTLLPKN